MNKREALEICAEGWLLLAESGSKDKPEMFADYENECPCCEYDRCQCDRQEPDGVLSDCRHCPIWGGGTSHCMSGNSPYAKWSHAGSPEDRKKYAKAIAVLARAELDKLPNEEANLG